MPIKLTAVKAFTQDPLQGNPVGVCIVPTDLPDETCFKISQQTGFSECVFITCIDNIPVLRFFSPAKEMAMCGHATLAAAHVLREQYRPILFKTNSGDVCIEYLPDGRIELVLKAKPCWFTDVPKVDHIAHLLGIDSNAIKADPVKISVGTPKVLVELNSEDHLWSMQPDFKQIAQDIAQGIYPFVRITNNLYYARQFNPAIGINKDPVTGVAAGALGVYLKKQQIFQFCVEQGHLLHKRGTIFVDVSDGVKIGGYATVFDELCF